MKKRALTAWLLTLSILCAIVLPAGAAEPRTARTVEIGFTDVSTRHYAREAIAFWTERGVLSGYPDGTFRPDGSLLRAEMAVILQNVIGYQDRAENVWTDLPQKAWYTDSVLALASRGVLSGTGKGKMSPKTTITRQEAFVMLANALGIEPEEGEPGFADDSQIASWAVGYVNALKKLGYIRGYAGANTVRPTATITRAETVTLLSQMVPGYVSENGVYSISCPGRLLVRAGDVTLKDMTVEGDLIVTEAVGEGDVYLDNVTVKGDVILYGCGENSFHLLPGCKVDKIIVTKTTGGRIRVVNESGQTIPLIWVNDGVAGVTLDGDHLGEVVVACDAPVAVKAKTVGTLSVTGNANLTVSKESTVASLEVASTAGGAKVAVEGKVVAMVNDGGASVTGNTGTGAGGNTGSGSHSGSGSGSSGGSGSGGGTVTPPPSKTTLSEVTIQLLAPAFAAIPDEADPLGSGFTTRIQWLNADGSAPSYRWRAADSTEDTFTAAQEYKAVVTLIPGSKYEFGNSLQVNVVDGNGGTFTPATSEKKGNNWEVTLTYPATEAKEYVEGLYVSGVDAMLVTETVTLKPYYADNRLIDPGTYTYKWYKCDAADGTGKTEVADTKEYTIPTDAARAAADGNGMLYYMVEVTAGGKTYASAVHDIEVEDPLDDTKVPEPKLPDALTWLENDYSYGYLSGASFRLNMDDVMKHKNLTYNVELTYVGDVEKRDGTKVSIAEYDEYYQSQCHRTESLGRWGITRREDGSAYGSLLVEGRIMGILPREIQPQPNYYGDGTIGYWGDVKTITVNEIQVKVTPRIYYTSGDSRNKDLTDRIVEKTYDLGEQPLVYNMVRSDDPTNYPYDSADPALAGTPYWSEEVLEGSPIPGTYHYTGRWEPYVSSYNGEEGLMFSCSLRRIADGIEDENYPQLVRITQKMEESGTPYIARYYTMHSDLVLRGTVDQEYEEHMQVDFYYADEAWESSRHGYTSREEEGVLIGANTFLIYHPEKLVYNCYWMDNTNAEYFMYNN